MRVINKITGFFKVKTGAKILLLCYVSAVVFYALSSVFILGVDRVGRLLGLIETRYLTAAELTATDLEVREGDILVSLSTDPQFLAQLYGTHISSVLLHLDYTIVPGEVCMYYLTGDEQQFAANKRVFGSHVGGDILFAMSGGQVNALRVDPTNSVGEVGYFNGIELNPYLPTSFYLLPSGGDAFYLLFYPAIGAPILYALYCFFEKRQKS